MVATAGPDVVFFMVDQMGAKWLEAAREMDICAQPRWLLAFR